MAPLNSNFRSHLSRFKLWKGCWILALVAIAQCLDTAGGVAQENTFEPLQRTVKVLSTNLDGFGIPFKVANDSGQFIEVQLYISRDRGQSWTFHSRQPTSAREFPFEADGDGEYWFAIKTLDRDRRLVPDGDARAELKIVVDSEKPKLEFQIQSDAAGRVGCRWQASDSGLNINTFKIQYRSANGDLSSESSDESWQTVPVQLQRKVQGANWADQLAWWPDTSDQRLEVRMQIADFAGNSTSVNRFVAVQRTAWRKSTSGSTLGKARQQTGPNGLAQSNPIHVSEGNDTSSAAAAWQPKLKPITSPQRNPVREQPQVASSPENRWRINETSSHQRAGRPAERLASRQLPAGVEVVAPPVPPGWNLPGEFAPPEPIVNSGLSVPWESDVESQETTERAYSGSTISPAPELPPARNSLPPRITDSIESNPATTIRSGKNFISESTTSWPDNQWNGPTSPKVNPQVALAPNAKRELVPIGRPNQDSFTQRPNVSNAGFRKQQPESVLDSPNRQPIQSAMPDAANTQIISTKRFQLNYDINSIDPSGVGQIDLWMTRDRGQTWKLWGQDPDNVSPFPVEVTEEGIYGFRIVVRSKDGLAGRGPVRGEEADMWVQVDVTAPLVKITSVPYGRGSEAGQLIVNYAVSDSNLALRPNRILWTTGPDGPWTTIEENLRNDGRLLWKPERNVPRRIFLRLEAVDRAGNVGAHNLAQAIDISGLIPRGTIFGVTPVGE